MINTSIKLSFRALWRKRSFSLINILGLAVGIGAGLLIFLVIRHELTYDDYQTKRDRIYRVVTSSVNRSNGEVAWTHSMVVLPLASGLQRTFPTLEKVATIWEIGGAQIYVPGKDLSDEKRFRETGGLFFTEPSLFDILDFSWLDGNATGLKEPNTVVLEEGIATNYFGSIHNAMGKTIQLWSYRVPLRVIGVFKNLTEHTDIPLRMGVSNATRMNLIGNAQQQAEAMDDWRSLAGNSACLVLLPKNENIKRLQAQLPAFVKNHYKEDEAHTFTTTRLTFQPMREMHLDKRFGTIRGNSLSTKELWALGLIGTFLLLVACINFINLATAQAVTRAKEIGVRKVLGSNRLQLLKQFLNETALITFLALIGGIILALLFIPQLNQLTGKTLTMDLLHTPSILLFLLATGVLVTLLAGFYPAMVLSGFSPVAAIKNKISARTVGGISLRRGLVVFQFIIAQLLVIGTLVVVKQMKYFRQQSMGFQKEAIVLVDLPSDSTLKTKYPYLKTRMLELPGVASAALCSNSPSSISGYFTDVFYNNDAEKQPYSIKRLFADTGYLNTFKMSMVAGRLPYASDTARELLVNETLVKKLGLKSPEEILGKLIGFKDNSPRYPVVGVLRDFNNSSLRDPIQPTVLTSDYDQYGTLALRLQPGEKMAATLKQVQKTFTEVYPTYLYDPTFFDDRIGRFYTAEAMTAQLFKAFAFLAIFISCLGLYGLVSFMAVQKTKEVGIRKVLGASVQHIVYLFSKEFTLLIGIAFIIAAPLGYYFMQEWLAGFYYHTSMGWGIFVLAVLLSIGIAWAAVGYKAVRAALANPVKSLRAE